MHGSPRCWTSGWWPRTCSSRRRAPSCSRTRSACCSRRCWGPRLERRPYKQRTLGKPQTRCPPDILIAVVINFDGMRRDSEGSERTFCEAKCVCWSAKTPAAFLLVLTMDALGSSVIPYLHVSKPTQRSKRVALSTSTGSTGKAKEPATTKGELSISETEADVTTAIRASLCEGVTRKQHSTGPPYGIPCVKPAAAWTPRYGLMDTLYHEKVYVLKLIQEQEQGKKKKVKT